MNIPEFEALEHTGDIGLRVRATDLADLFVIAARGLYQLSLGPPEGLSGHRQRFITLEADAVDELLVDWLTELNFLLTVHFEYYPLISVLEVRENHISAQVSGLLLDSDRLKIQTEIKAVTYHQLKVVREPHGWEARVLFDI